MSLFCFCACIDLVLVAIKFTDFSAAVPIAVVLIPFIVDMANGLDDESDIIVQRAISEESS